MGLDQRGIIKGKMKGTNCKTRVSRKCQHVLQKQSKIREAFPEGRNIPSQGDFEGG